MTGLIQEKIDWLDGQVQAKIWWLESHGEGSKRPWPPHDIEAKQHGLKMLQNIRADYAEMQREGAR
jgi:hypothetical protein